MNTHHIFIFIMTAVLVLCICPSMGYAQDSISELEKNVNASGKKRTGDSARVAAEFGMGIVGGVASLAVAVGVGCITNSVLEGHPHDMGANFVFPALIVLELTSPPLNAGGVYLGGWLTGGRASAGPVFGGAYIGAAVGGVLFGTGWLVHSDILIMVGALAIPIFSLIGSVVGYELSEKHETKRLESERDKLMLEPVSQPITIKLFSGTF